MKPHATTNTPIDDKDLWETPQEVVDAVVDRIGMPVVLDVCSTRSSTKARTWFGPGGVREDAMSQDWAEWMTLITGETGPGIAWMNPPYSRGNLSRWTSEAMRLANNRHMIACLVPHAPDTTWWQEYIDPQASLIMMPTRRIRFLRPDGTPGDSPPGPSAICLLTPWGGPAVYERLEI